jgi:hypothetical protein
MRSAGISYTHSTEGNIVLISSFRRALTTGLLALAMLVSLGLVEYATSAHAHPTTLNLETLTGVQAEKMLENSSRIISRGSPR